MQNMKSILTSPSAISTPLPVTPTSDLALPSATHFPSNEFATKDEVSTNGKGESISKSEYEQRQTPLKIEKYTFMNLCPLSSLELKYLGMNDNYHSNGFENGIKPLVNLLGEEININNLVDAQNILGEEKIKLLTESKKINSCYPDTSASNPFNKLASHSTQFPQPDISKMLPFKSNKNAFNGLQLIPGGGMFLFPSIIADTIKRLPPPNSFNVRM